MICILSPYRLPLSWEPWATLNALKGITERHFFCTKNGKRNYDYLQQNIAIVWFNQIKIKRFGWLALCRGSCKQCVYTMYNKMKLTMTREALDFEWRGNTWRTNGNSFIHSFTRINRFSLSFNFSQSYSANNYYYYYFIFFCQFSL